MKKTFFILIGLLLFADAFSQNKALDSINAIIKKAPSDTAVARCYLSLSELLYVSKPDTLIPLGLKALEIVERKLPSAGKVEKKCLLKIKAEATNNIGYTYEQLGYIAKALDFYDKSSKLFERIGDKQGLAATLNNMGYIYQNQGSPEKALEYHKKCFKLLSEIGDRESMARSLINTGLIYQNKENFDISFEFFERAIKLGAEINAQKVINAATNNLGYLYELKNDYKKALENYLKTLDYYNKSNDVQGKIYSLTNIARIYGKQKRWNVAMKYAMPMLELSQKLKYPVNIRNAALLLSESYEYQGKQADAFKMYKLYVQMRDSVFNQETRKATVKKQFQHDYEIKTAADSIRNLEVQKVKDAQIQTQTVQLKQEKTQRIALYGGLTLVLIFSGIIFNRFKITQKQKVIIEDQKLIVEEKNKEIVDSINYAKRLQDAILPPVDLVKQHFPNSFILYKPKDIVAGDFYWAEKINDTFFIAAADCTGHGVPGALVSVVCSNALNRAVKEFNLTFPGSILDKVTELVLETFEKSQSEVKDGMDIVLCAWKTENGKMEIEFAGANNPLWYIRGGELIEIKPDKQPVGSHENRKSFTTHSLTPQKGDSFYLFTDGYADQFGGPQGKKFKYKQLEAIFLSHYNLPMQEQEKTILNKFNLWKGSLEQLDDVLIIGIHV